MAGELLKYSADAALKLLPSGRLGLLKDGLLAARDETLNDVELWQSGGAIPEGKQPLDAGFIQWPEELLADLTANKETSLVGRLEACAARLQAAADSLVVLGIGGSYMGMRAMFKALRTPFHNEMSRSEKRNASTVFRRLERGFRSAEGSVESSGSASGSESWFRGRSHSVDRDQQVWWNA